MMKKFKHILLCAAAILVTTNIDAQPSIFQPGDYKDGVYDKENSTNRRVIPYTHLREADVTWEKRVWREIDMREKQNQQLYFPLEIGVSRISLLQVLFKYILKNELIAFSDEEFQVQLEPSVIRNKIVKIDTVEQMSYLEDGTEVATRVGTSDSTWMYRQFRKIRLKEDWFFDKQKSVLEVRILGMGIYTYDEEKEAPKEQFWVYFPSCRKFFAKHEVYNPKNDSERRTFEDIFWKRQFASVITKETNVFDRQISEYSKGIDALLESDRIKNDIFTWEHDQWHF
jgi:gliding motility associated protien GldN